LGESEPMPLSQTTERNLEPPLSLMLRRGSAADHEGLEQKVGYAGDTLSHEQYRRMLVMFRALHEAADHLREMFRDAGAIHGLKLQRRAFTDALDHDLAILGPGQPQPDDLSILVEPQTSFPWALGALYVAEGSALGNQLLLRQTTGPLAQSHAGATRFLTESTSGAGAQFRAFKLGLDAFGRAEPGAWDAVLAGTRQTFKACGAIIDRLT
jgi:heme oxygenase